jgi:hypothetical protein
MAPNTIIMWLRSRVRDLVAIALIPVALLSGQPVNGCICADGHYAYLCRAGHRTARHQESDVASASTESCSCCHHADVGKTSHDCCTEDADCCGSKQQEPQGAQHQVYPHISSKGCCTPVVSDAVERTLTASVQASDGHQAVALLAMMPDLLHSQLGELPGRHLLTDIRPPPDDLVVTLRRLVI